MLEAWHSQRLPGQGQQLPRTRTAVATLSLLPGNLLSSLMGSSEQEEGEESQDDSSPIELD